jgi:vacuolar-type H+-ATPase subunit H
MPSSTPDLISVADITVLSEAFSKYGPYLLGFVLLCFAYTAWRSKLKGALPIAVAALLSCAAVFGFALVVWEEERSSLAAQRDQAADRIRTANEQATRITNGAIEDSRRLTENARGQAEIIVERARGDANERRARAEEVYNTIKTNAEAEAVRIRAEATRELAEVKAATDTSYVREIIIIMSGESMRLRDVLPPAMTNAIRVYWRMREAEGQLQLIITVRMPLKLEDIGVLYLRFQQDDGQISMLPICASALREADYLQINHTSSGGGEPRTQIFVIKGQQQRGATCG